MRPYCTVVRTMKYLFNTYLFLPRQLLPTPISLMRDLNFCFGRTLRRAEGRIWHRVPHEDCVRVVVCIVVVGGAANKRAQDFCSSWTGQVAGPNSSSIYHREDQANNCSVCTRALNCQLSPKLSFAFLTAQFILYREFLFLHLLLDPRPFAHLARWWKRIDWKMGAGERERCLRFFVAQSCFDTFRSSCLRRGEIDAEDRSGRVRTKKSRLHKSVRTPHRLERVRKKLT